MYTIRYFNDLGLDTGTEKFPTIQTMIDFINQNPNLNYSIVLYNDHFVAPTIDHVILNGKPRRKFINYMSHMTHVLDNYISPWKVKK